MWLLPTEGRTQDCSPSSPAGEPDRLQDREEKLGAEDEEKGHEVKRAVRPVKEETQSGRDRHLALPHAGV